MTCRSFLTRLAVVNDERPLPSRGLDLFTPTDSDQLIKIMFIRNDRILIASSMTRMTNRSVLSMTQNSITYLTTLSKRASTYSNSKSVFDEAPLGRWLLLIAECQVKSRIPLSVISENYVTSHWFCKITKCSELKNVQRVFFFSESKNERGERENIYILSISKYSYAYAVQNYETNEIGFKNYWSNISFSIWQNKRTWTKSVQ
jgi:hypothetical protein